MTESSLALWLPDSYATEALGAALARAHAAGRDANGRRGAVLHLQGELGAGKTTCIRSLLHASGVAGTVRSPSYTLVEIYELPGLTCVHVDLYRLRVPAEVDELGLREYLGGDCLLLVEWPEKGGGHLAPADLGLMLEYHEDARRGTLHGRSMRGCEWLHEVVQDRSLLPYVSHLT